VRILPAQGPGSVRPGSLHYAAHRSNSKGTSPNFGRKTRGRYKSGICDTKPAIGLSLKRSGPEPKLPRSIYRNSCMPTAYRWVTNLVTYGELWPTFLGSKFFSTRDISDSFCRSATTSGHVTGLAVAMQSKLIPGFRDFGAGVPRYHAPTCINSSLMHF